MKKFNQALLFAIVMVLVSGCQTKSDYFGWRGPDRDGTYSGFVMPETWPESLTMAWKTEVGEADASPILVNDKIYQLTKLDSKEQVICLDSETGELLWKTEINTAPEITGGARSHPGPRSTPAYVDGMIVTHGASGMLACLDAGNGEIIWKTDTYTSEIPKFFTSASPLILDEMCILHLGGHDNGIIVALDYKTGEEIWKIEGEPSTYSSAVVWKTEENQILVQTEIDLLGITYDGEIKWRIPTPPGQRYFYNSSTPVYDDNVHFISGQGIGTTAYKVNYTNGDFTIDSLWNNPDNGVSFCTPIIRDGQLIANDQRFGLLYSLDISDGTEIWKDTTKLNRFASVFDLGEVLVSSAASGDLIFFEPNASEFKQIARYKISETEVYASPVFHQDKIFIKDEKTLTCWLIE